MRARKTGEYHPLESFIYVKKNAIPPQLFDSIIERFESRPDLHEAGRVGDFEVNDKAKISTDIGVGNPLIEEWKDIIHPLLHGLSNGLSDYKKKFTFKDKCGIHGVDSIRPWGLHESFNIQRYYPGEGFYRWHCENYGGECYRLLVWMFYLNTCKNAGTEFKYQKMKTECEQGSLVIWPAGWTHYHRGIISNTDTKYIVTGWLGFDE